MILGGGGAKWDARGDLVQAPGHAAFHCGGAVKVLVIFEQRSIMKFLLERNVGRGKEKEGGVKALRLSKKKEAIFLSQWNPSGLFQAIPVRKNETMGLSVPRKSRSFLMEPLFYNGTLVLQWNPCSSREPHHFSHWHVPSLRYDRKHPLTKFLLRTFF